MTTFTSPRTIIDYCLEPLVLDASAENTQEVRRRLEHVIKTFQAKANKPLSVDFSAMPSQVINEAAHGYE